MQKFLMVLFEIVLPETNAIEVVFTFIVCVVLMWLFNYSDLFKNYVLVDDNEDLNYMDSTSISPFR